jgi:hypothetical protein
MKSIMEETQGITCTFCKGYNWGGEGGGQS